MDLLEGRVALVVGGAGDLGGATARCLVEQGAAVVICDPGAQATGLGGDDEAAASMAAELRAGGGRAAGCSCDAATGAGAREAVAFAVERFERLDVLVNAAGAAVQIPLVEMDEPTWDRLVAVHLKATFLCTQQAARQMIAQGGGGRVVNFTSAAGLHGAGGGQAGYAAAKAAVYGLTRAAAVELERHGITVNAVAPVALTRSTRGQSQLEGLEPLGVEHVAPAVLFFASSLCGDRTGEVLGVGGGRIHRWEVVESRGAFKEGGEPWTADEMAEHWDRIAKRR